MRWVRYLRNARVWPATALVAALSYAQLPACSLHRAPSASGTLGATTGGTGGGGGAGVGGGAAGDKPDAGLSQIGKTDAAQRSDASLHDAASPDANLAGDGSVDAGPLGYEPGAVGAPCTVDAQCQLDGTMRRICLAQSYFEPLLTLPGGYCGKLCDPSLRAPCESGAACITIPTFPPIPACLRRCRMDTDCRVQAGYSCNKPFTSTESVCSLRN
jgi:hypothetical protein